MGKAQLGQCSQISNKLVCVRTAGLGFRPRCSAIRQFPAFGVAKAKEVPRKLCPMILLVHKWTLTVPEANIFSFLLVLID
jgi:hypothetical protein